MAFTKIAAAGIGSTGTVTLENLVVTGGITASLTGTATSTTNIPNLSGAITSNNTTTSLGSFSSANLATALTNKTGSGENVFATGPTLTTVTVSSGGINVTGVSTLGNTVIGGGTTQLVVTGNARITGILTIGTSSITLDGSNNQLNVGTGVTLHHTNGVQVGGNTLHSTGLTLNSLTVTGVSTFTNGPVLVGAATSTGTASQPLQVTGGAYVSGNLGIGTGTASPTYKLTIDKQGTADWGAGLKRILSVDNNWVYSTFRTPYTVTTTTHPAGWYNIVKILSWDFNVDIHISFSGDFTADQIDIEAKSSWNAGLNNNNAGPHLRVNRTMAHNGNRLQQVRIGYDSIGNTYIQAYLNLTFGAAGAVKVAVVDKCSAWADTIVKAEPMLTTATSITVLNTVNLANTAGEYYNLNGGACDFVWGTNATERLRITSAGHTLPGTDGAYDLGSTSLRWRNLYTTDLHLSNEGKPEGNQIDGTTGNWTIQEGEESLYIINNKSLKKYMFILEEIV